MSESVPKKDGGQIAAMQLRKAGIDALFGVVAGPSIQIFAGAHEVGMRVIGGRLELNAGFMAQAWGYQKKKPGVMVVGSGPGMSNAVTPLYVATASGFPLVVLGGSAFSQTRGVGGFQEADQVALARPASKWVGQVDRTERIPEWIHLALGKALEGRPGGVYLDFPGEVVAKRIPAETIALRENTSVSAPYPDPNLIDEAATLLASAKRPVIVLGKGAAWSDAGPAIQKLVDRGIPYVCSPMARGTIPDDHPNFANGARSMALGEADLIVMFGGRFNWIFGHGRRFAAHSKIIQFDLEAEEMISGAPVSLGIVSDACKGAELLDQALDSTKVTFSSGSWLRNLREKSEANAEKVRAALLDDSTPINPYRLVHEVSAVAPREAIITAEGETIMGICRAVLPSYVNRGRLNAGTTGCMGVGAPYAIGSAIANPEAPSIAVLGDYAFGAAVMSVETAARCDIKATLVVANNEGIAGHGIQDAMMPSDAPRIASLLPARYEKIAEMVDGHSEYVEQPNQIRPALERALSSDKIAVVHVRIDPKAGRLSGSNYLA